MIRKDFLVGQVIPNLLTWSVTLAIVGSGGIAKGSRKSFLSKGFLLKGAETSFGSCGPGKQQGFRCPSDSRIRLDSLAGQGKAFEESERQWAEEEVEPRALYGQREGGGLGSNLAMLLVAVCSSSARFQKTSKIGGVDNETDIAKIQWLVTASE